MKYSVDRIEENIAVCEDENSAFENFALDTLPEGIMEGDMFEIVDGVAILLADETQDRKKKLASLQKSLFTKKKRAD